MPIAQPSEAAHQAFNTAIHLHGEQQDELRAIAWKLQGLFARNRGDVTAALGLIHAHTMLGERDQAVTVLQELWGRRAAMPIDDCLTLAILEQAVGRFPEAIELATSRTAEVPAPLRTQQISIVQQSVSSSWQPAPLVLQLAEKWVVFKTWYDDAGVSGLLPVMRDRQDLVNGILMPVHCGTFSSLGSEGHEGVHLTRFVYAVGSYADRNILSERLDDALAEFYVQHRIDEGHARDLMSEVILPLTARPAASEEVALEAA